MSGLEKLFEGKPWPIKVFFSLGGYLMSAFSSKFPDGLQSAGLYSGIAVAALGSVSLVWSYFLKGSLRAKMNGAFGLVSACYVAGIVWLSIIASGDRLTLFAKSDSGAFSVGAVRKAVGIRYGVSRVT
jgi:hypothetical protein